MERPLKEDLHRWVVAAAEFAFGDEGGADDCDDCCHFHGGAGENDDDENVRVADETNGYVNSSAVTVVVAVVVRFDEVDARSSYDDDTAGECAGMNYGYSRD